MRWLTEIYGEGYVDYAFWQNLKEGYDAFETTRRVPLIFADDDRYLVRPAETPPSVSLVQSSAP